MRAAKVLVLSLRPPHFPRPSSLFASHRNNLVIDDVKADRVQQLDKVRKKGQRFTVSMAALHLSPVHGTPPQEHTYIYALVEIYSFTHQLHSFAETAFKDWVKETVFVPLYMCLKRESGGAHCSSLKNSELYCKPVMVSVPCFSWKCLWCMLQGVDRCPEFNAFLLTNSLLGASSHDHRWEGATFVTKWLREKKRKQPGVFGSVQSSFVSNHHPHPWTPHFARTLTFSISHPHRLSSWRNTVVKKKINERTQIFLINIWEKHLHIRPPQSPWCGEISPPLATWGQRLPPIRPVSRQVYFCWCDHIRSGSKKFCQVYHDSVGEVQRAWLLTDLMYQPWHSQFANNLKTRWRRAGNETRECSELQHSILIMGSLRPGSQ